METQFSFHLSLSFSESVDLSSIHKEASTYNTLRKDYFYRFKYVTLGL